MFLSFNRTLYRVSLEDPTQTQIVYPHANIGLIAALGGYVYWLYDPPHLARVVSIPYPFQSSDEPTFTDFEVHQDGIYKIRAVSESNQPMENGEKYEANCAAKKCSHFCLRKSFHPYVSCACPAGIRFAESIESSLRSPSQCNEKPNAIMLVSNKDELAVLSLDQVFILSYEFSKI